MFTKLSVHQFFKWYCRL